MYFRNCRLWKFFLDHSLKSSVSEHALTVNVWKGPKCLQNLHGNVLIMFFIILGELDSENVSHSATWIPGAFCLHIDCRWQVILFKVVRICNSQFKSSYLNNKKLFLNFLLHFWILHQILNILREKMNVIANGFPKLQTVKISVRKLSKEHRFRTGFESQRVKVLQLLWKSPWERLYLVFHHSCGSWFGKCLPQCLVKS